VKQVQEEQAGKVITKAAQRYRANKERKAWVQKAKTDLEAEIAKLQEELQAGSPQPKQPSAKSKAVSKAMASIKDFWKKDMTQEEARQARKDAREAKNDALKKTEDNLAAKTKALKDKRKQLEALGYIIEDLD
jgi:chromosome segregation ATPase